MIKIDIKNKFKNYIKKKTLKKYQKSMNKKNKQDKGIMELFIKQ